MHANTKLFEYYYILQLFQMFYNKMKIKNYTSLANTKRKKIALSILEEGLKSALPQRFLKKIT